MAAKKSLRALMAEYDAHANPGKGKRHKESFVGWMTRHGYDVKKITEDEWINAMRRGGSTDDQTLDYIESIAETVGMG